MSTTSSAAGVLSSKKIVARVALLGVDEPHATVLSECFRQFGIQTVAMSGDFAARLQKEKFEGCVLRLEEGAAAVLEAIRKSPSNSRMVVYGIAPNMREALAFSKYGINAVLDDPMHRHQALKAVRATYLLVVHELRRYVRLPLVTEVRVEFDGRRFSGTTQEISAGGMSLRVPVQLAVSNAVETLFDLPNLKSIAVAASVCWLRPVEGLVGLRFDAQDERRLAVKGWIERYLDMD